MTKPPPMEAIKVPLKQLPNGLKKRTTKLASIDDFQIDYQTSPELEPISSPRPDVRDQLYITDDEFFYQWATKKLFLFRIFKFMYWVFRYWFEGQSLRPTWHSVLSVDEVIQMGRLIYVSDTLVVNCQSIEAFEKLIPFICGPYTRLMIHGGDIKLDQLRRLMKETVRKVETTAEIKLKSSEYDDAIQLIFRHVQGFGYNFSLKSTPELITRVKSALRNNRDLVSGIDDDNCCNVIHWKKQYIDLFLVLFNMSNMLYWSDRTRRGPRYSEPSDYDEVLCWLVLAFFFCLGVLFTALFLAAKPKPNRQIKLL